jgi:hypothetical protein
MCVKTMALIAAIRMGLRELQHDMNGRDGKPAHMGEKEQNKQLQLKSPMKVSLALDTELLAG